MRKFIAKMAVLLAVVVPVVAQAEVIPEKGKIYLKVYRDGVLELTTFKSASSHWVTDVSKVGCDWNQTVIKSAKSLLDPEKVVKTCDGLPYEVEVDSNAIVYECRYYTAHTITVGYDGNGSTGGSTASTAFKYNTAGTIAKNGFSRSFTVNYNGNGGTAGRSSEKVTAAFNCWADTASGSAAYTYSSGQTAVTNPCDSTGGNVTLYARWNDGSVTLPSASWNGHTLKGWYTDSVGGTRVGGAGDSYRPISKDQPLYAQWEADTYNVTLHKNGGTCEDLTKYTYGVGAKLPTATRSECSFNGWYDNSVFSGSAVTEISKTATGDREFWAKFTPNQYTVTTTVTPSGSGTVEVWPSGSSQPSGKEITITADPNTGYAFWKWDSDPGQKEIYENPHKFILTQDVQFRANFTNLMCTVTFNPMGGTCSVTNRIVKYGSSIGELPTPTYGTRDFKGWFDDQVEGTRITQNTTVKNDMTAYAHWGEAQQYKITVKAEPTTGGTVTGDGTYDKDSKVTLGATANPGYSFTQWNDGVTAASREIMVTEDATYTANFTGNVYKVFFEVNEEELYTRYLTHGQKFGELPTPKSQAGKMFDGWYDDDGTKERITSDSIVKVTENKYSFYAHWSEPKSYTVTFDGNGATSGSMTPQSIPRDEKTALKANEYARTGYAFRQWKDLNGKTYQDKAEVLNLAEAGETVSLFAEWNANKYAISFNGNGATGGSMSSLTDCQYDKDVKLTANGYVRDGYGFSGWATNQSGAVVFADKATVRNLTAKNNETVTLYAQWHIHKNTVHFDGNGSTGGAMVDQVFEYGVTNALSPNQFEKSGYTFRGWATNGVTEVVYTNEQEVAFYDPDGTTNTLKAVWAANTYTMHFEPNATTVLNPTAQSDISNCVSGVGVKLPKCPYINLPSCGFIGWVDENSVTNQAGATVTHTVAKSGETVTYEAAWQGNSKLSEAVGLDTVTALTNTAKSATDCWKVSREGAQSGGTCVCYEIPTSQGSVPNLKMSMLVNGPGTLTFCYKKSAAVLDWDYLDLEIDGTAKIRLSDTAETTYKECTYTLEDSGLHAVTWDCSSLGDKSDGRIFYIDDVMWTPKGGKPKPLILFIR